ASIFSIPDPRSAGRRYVSIERCGSGSARSSRLSGMACRPGRGIGFSILIADRHGRNNRYLVSVKRRQWLSRRRVDHPQVVTFAIAHLRWVWVGGRSTTMTDDPRGRAARLLACSPFELFRVEAVNQIETAPGRASHTAPPEPECRFT